MPAATRRSCDLAGARLRPVGELLTVRLRYASTNGSIVDTHPFTARCPERAARGSRRLARRPLRSSFGLLTTIKQFAANVTPVQRRRAETGSRRPLPPDRLPVA